MPSLCSGFSSKILQIFPTRITSLRSVILVGGENDKKGEAGSFMPKTKWLRHFQMYRSQQNRSKLHFSAPATFCHSVPFWALKKGLLAPFLSFCGELGIRTPGPVTVNSFQDCRNRPLCQLSAANVGRETEFCKNTCNLYG